MDAGFCSWTVTSSAVNTSPLTVGHTATHPSLVPWLPPFNWLCTKQCWLPERGPCPAIITPSMGWHADRQGGGGLQACLSVQCSVFSFLCCITIMFPAPPHSRRIIFSWKIYMGIYNSSNSILKGIHFWNCYGASLFDHVPLFNNSFRSDNTVFIKIHLASLIWRHGVGDIVGVKLKI